MKLTYWHWLGVGQDMKKAFSNFNMLIQSCLLSPRASIIFAIMKLWIHCGLKQRQENGYIIEQ